MSEVFENDIEKENSENLYSLEDDVQEPAADAHETFEFPQPLYQIQLEYSFESLYAASKNQLSLAPGDYVIIPTRYGKDIALVKGQAKVPLSIRPCDIIYIDRKATSGDLERAKSFKEKEKSAFKIFQEKAEAHHLEMKLISTHYLLEEQKILFFFSSDNRVDFRELVKDLVSVFKMRIELRQIGVRDESRITGGLGVCGRPYCCHSVSDRLRPVSIRMAKDQNLSLNSMKISGQCGRLLCCLSYEYDCYAEARKKLPAEGLKLHYDNTEFRVTEVNPLTAAIKILGEDGRLLEIPASRLIHKDGKWKISK
ncbi:MAG: stage 0 sporulation protein [Bacteroides sp.]|nr:stage 0 sporulation protein [Prevotella sp.]MCM1407994.1 hypothetical protein [Treponema brennaborense]MCM1468970.1 stage 0 sporulation protein [Bacteroides sp.]